MPLTPRKQGVPSCYPFKFYPSFIAVNIPFFYFNFINVPIHVGLHVHVRASVRHIQINSNIVWIGWKFNFGSSIQKHILCGMSSFVSAVKNCFWLQIESAMKWLGRFFFSANLLKKLVGIWHYVWHYSILKGWGCKGEKQYKWSFMFRMSLISSFLRIVCPQSQPFIQVTIVNDW